MTISALPQATIRLLGSSQALTTPTSLVKELIDNALDAKASSIDILISTNTLDKIEVRDNGHGIPQEDLEALGKHGHTSKLRSFEELRSIGGLSLGFRGEALASACQLGEITVTTKTEGESIAYVVKLKPLGGIAGQSRTSNPVGTTVSVTNFLSKIHVRKQTALKGAPKQLSKLKDLLQAYSLARPRVRFSLKVIKSSKGSWSYAPRPNDGIKEAVSLVIGRETANQCLEKSLVFPEHGHREEIDDGDENTDGAEPEPSNPENKPHEFVVDMFLPKPDAEMFKIGHGQYISIDSRPVSHDKGTMRKIVTLYKSYLKSSRSESLEKLKNPFLWMDIRCPVASYDANVEPAKDDVIFCNEELLLESIETALEDIYGSRNDRSKAQVSKLSTVQIDAIDVLEAHTPTLYLVDNVESPSMTAVSSEAAFQTQATPPQPLTDRIIEESENTGTVAAIEEDEALSSHNWSIDMSEDFSEEIEGLYKRKGVRNPNFHASSSASQNAHGGGLNPWLIAKMNAPLGPQYDTPTNGINAVQAARQPHGTLPTPQPSSDPDNFQPRSSQDLPRQPLQAYVATTLLQPSIANGSRIRRRQATDELDDDILLGEESTTFNHRNDFISARQLPDDASMLLGPSQPTPFKKFTGPKRVNNPFTPPTRTSEGAPSQDGLRQTKLNVGRRSRALSNPQDFPPDTDLAWAMDFEQRKEEATRQRREEMRVARAEARALQEDEETRLYGPKEIVENSPHKNRYNAAIATLEAEDETSHVAAPVKKRFKTSLPDGDSRAYLMRRQRSMSVRPGQVRTMSRAKSMRLPLERIPDKERVHSLLFTLSADMSKLRMVTANLKQTDLYLQRGVLGFGLILNEVEKNDINNKIHSIVTKWKGSNCTMLGDHHEEMLFSASD